MRNQNVDWNNSYDYSPNELARLSVDNPRLYREVVESNLEDISVEQWEQNNLKFMQKLLNQK